MASFWKRKWYAKARGKHWYAPLPDKDGGVGSLLRAINIATKASTPNLSSTADANHENVTYLVRHVVTTPGTQQEVRLLFTNWRGTINGDSPYTTGQVVIKNGVRYPVTYGNQSLVTIPVGGEALSDVIAGLTLTEGDVIFTRNFVSVATGGKYPVGHARDNSLSVEGAAQGDHRNDADNTAFNTTTFNEGLFHPAAITGKGVGSTAFLGDSIVFGLSGLSNMGYSHKTALRYRKSTLNLGLGSEKAQTVATSPNKTLRLKLAAAYATHAYVSYGVNDLVDSSVTFEQVRDWLKVIYSDLRAAGFQRIYGATIVPRNTSTDFFATIANQAFYNDNFHPTGTSRARIRLNNWIRAGADGLIDGYVDIADAVETSRDSGYWKPGVNRYVQDGVHPLEMCHTGLSYQVNLDMMEAGQFNPRDLTIPEPPTNLFVNASPDSVALNWVAAPNTAGDLAGYHVYRNGVQLNANTGEITGTYYYDSTVSAGQTYTYEVASVDYCGNLSSKVSQVVTATTPSPATVYDSFNRAASATALGTTEVGGLTWTTNLGTWGVNANKQAYVSTYVADASATVDTGTSDVTLEARLLPNSRLIFRYTDNNNFLGIQNDSSADMKIIKKQAGTLTTAALTSGLVKTGNDTVRVELSGSSIKLYVNGVMKLTHTNTFNQTATKHGIGAVSSAVLVDNFRVY